MTDIIRDADVSVSTFQNIFRSKDGVLLDLAESMFENQFEVAGRVVGENASPALLYAVETSVQLAIAELNENVREVYVETYSHPRTAEYVYQKTSSALHRLLGKYQPDRGLSDFYEMEIGSSGMMRNYMARPCDKYFTLNRKLESFLTMALRAYCVPPEEIQSIILTIQQIDILKLAESVLQELFKMLSMRFDFHLSEN